MFPNICYLSSSASFFKVCLVWKSILPPGEEDLGRHSDHPAGHDGAGRLRRIPELHPQPVLRVGQIQRVGWLLEQAESGQETSQPAGNGALLLQRERAARRDTEHGTQSLMGVTRDVACVTPNHTHCDVICFQITSILFTFSCHQGDHFPLKTIK